MPWMKPIPGPFAHWSGHEPDDLAIDPYLLWADATRFVHTGKHCRSRHSRIAEREGPGSERDVDRDLDHAVHDHVPADIPVLIELHEGWDAPRLRQAAGDLIAIPRAYGKGDRFVTARIEPGFIPEAATGALAGAVARVELGVPNRPERPPKPFHGAPPMSGTRVLLGAIDAGCPFAHRALRRAGGGTRILGLWDQETCADEMAFGDAPAKGVVPGGFGYGRQVVREELDALIQASTFNGTVNEDACYEAARYRPLRWGITHGAHILDLFAGRVPLAHRTWRRVPGEAPTQPGFQPSDGGAAVESDIVFVQFPRDALGDTTGGWLCVHVLDAVRYILSCKGPGTERVVINLSYGNQVGPHDGTATLERALTKLCEAHPYLEIVLPAGNSFDRRAHAGGTVGPPKAGVPPGERLPRVRWSVPVGCEAPTFVELWMRNGARTGVRVSLPLSPAVASPVLMPGECRVWPDTANPSVGVFHLDHPACGKDGSMVLVALAPTTTFNPRIAVAPAGYWRIELECDSADGPQVDAYIARNDPDIGQPLRGRTASFIDAGYDPDSTLRPADDDNVPAGPVDVVQRRGTMNWTFPAPADAAPLRVHVVAGRVLNTQFPNGVRKQYHPPYSSAGPDRMGRVKAPEGSCITDESVVLRGVRAAATRSGGHARIVGTSTASPQLARLLANAPPPPPTIVTPTPANTIDYPLEGATAFDCPDA